MTEPRLVKIGNHEILMTAEEAVNLTAEQRESMAAAAEAADRALEARLAEGAAESERVRAAAAEGGRLLVQVWCGACGDGASPVAEVRYSSEGLVFVGVGQVEMGQGEERSLRKGFRERLGHRVPFLARGRVEILLNERVGDWPPRTDCAQHGRYEIDADTLIRAARSARRRPAKVILRR